MVMERGATERSAARAPGYRHGDGRSAAGGRRPRQRRCKPGYRRAVTILRHLLAAAGPLNPPFGSCGIDPTADELDYVQYSPLPRYLNALWGVSTSSTQVTATGCGVDVLARGGGVRSAEVALPRMSAHEVRDGEAQALEIRQGSAVHVVQLAHRVGGRNVAGRWRDGWLQVCPLRQGWSYLRQVDTPFALLHTGLQRGASPDRYLGSCRRRRALGRTLGWVETRKREVRPARTCSGGVVDVATVRTSLGIVLIAAYASIIMGLALTQDGQSIGRRCLHVCPGKYPWTTQSKEAKRHAGELPVLRAETRCCTRASTARSAVGAGRTAPTS